MIVQKMKTSEGARLIEHWEEQSGKKRPRFCSVRCCASKPEVGGLVKRSNKHFIVPVCLEHHSEEDVEFDLVDEIPLVPFDSTLL